ncbi:hypothetical protein [Pseudomonas sp. FEN]|uniref:hypothetical protein n=1 Tax=Pseudomonas sp. FEN TaxID=2767468 RepID=UPI00174D3884|nr:hypothetical protein [Pseudomonas sp. FEN]
MLSSNHAKEGQSTGAPGGVTVNIADWLCLAAAPTFASMAVLTAANTDLDMACASMQGPWPLNSMVTMYLIMAAVHLSPWLRLIGGHAGRSRG